MGMIVPITIVKASARTALQFRIMYVSREAVIVLRRRTGTTRCEFSAMSDNATSRGSSIVDDTGTGETYDAWADEEGAQIKALTPIIKHTSNLPLLEGLTPLTFIARIKPPNREAAIALKNSMSVSLVHRDDESDKATAPDATDITKFLYTIKPTANSPITMAITSEYGGIEPLAPEDEVGFSAGNATSSKDGCPSYSFSPEVK
jgi:hypothetical protein